MGWLYMHRPKGFSDLDWFKREWGSDIGERIRGTASIRRQVFYAALASDPTSYPEFEPGEDGKVVICLVVLMRWVVKDHLNFGYKDQSEMMGPVDAECPESVLDLLSPIKPDALAAAQAKIEAEMAASGGRFAYHPMVSAHEWREKCRRLAAVRKAVKKEGAKFDLAEPLRFTDGVTSKRLVSGPVYARNRRFIREDGRLVSLTARSYANLIPVAESA